MTRLASAKRRDARRAVFSLTDKSVLFEHKRGSEMTDRLIKNGNVVDGTGAAGYKADVRIKDGIIAEVGVDLQPQGEEVYDADGCIVSPGFIESHTHYDCSMWWDEKIDPCPGYGATTMIMGNCGFSMAPLHPDKAVQHEVMKIFAFFEDMPLRPFEQRVPWNWSNWSEYREETEKNVKVPLNYAMFVGHIPIRLSAMGLDAWTRAATDDEIAHMCELLDDALAAGAIGMSSNLFDVDGDNRMIPTLIAEDKEFAALFDVMQRYENTQYQLVVDTFRIMTAPASVKRMTGLLKDRNIRVQIAGGRPNLSFQDPILPTMNEALQEMEDAGIDSWPGHMHVSPTLSIGVQKSLLFAQSGDQVWHEVVKAPTHDEKRALLSDPEWRKRARESWDSLWDHAPLQQPQNLVLLDSENDAGPQDITLKEYADELGVHHSDAAAEWLLRNGIMSTIHFKPFPMNDDLVINQIKDKKTIGNISDAGAHIQMLCGGGDNILLFTDYMKRENGPTLEECIHSITGQLADAFFLSDRGRIEVGKRADITVFNLDEIDHRPWKKVWEVPTGEGNRTWRYTRDPAPMRLTLVNGVATFEGGDYTDARPGVFMPHNEVDDTMAIAAE